MGARKRKPIPDAQITPDSAPHHVVFISYANEDGLAANLLCEKLERSGIRCWIAPRDAHPGIPYGAQIARAIGSSRMLLLVLSSHANRSRAVLSEVELGANRGNILVPVRIEDVQPAEGLEYYIRAVQWFDATKPPLDERLGEFVAFARELLNATPEQLFPSASGENGLGSRRFSLPIKRSNLPQQMTALVGRTSDVETVKALVLRERLVTVSGTGGTGKTRVAIAVAASLIDDFSDGVWFVDLAPLRSAELVAGEIASVLDLKQSARQSVLETVVEHLTNRKVLLIIDNCEHLIAEVSRVSELMLRQCSGVKLLTSREPLQIDGERVFRLPSLATAPAGGADTIETALGFAANVLFVERAQAASPSFVLTGDNASSVGEICRRLDGIPLAIELAAARTSSLSPLDICKRLDERFRILTEGYRTALPRHQTMRAMIDWSYDGLSEPEQVLFRRVAVFAGGCTIEAAESVCAFSILAASDVLNHLDALVRKSLVVVDFNPDGTRYRLLESTRAYALEKAHHELPELSERHATWASESVQSISDHEWTMVHEQWLARIECEIDNLRVAMQWALSEESRVWIVGRIAGQLASFWYDAGLRAEGLRWIEAALAKIDDKVQPKVAGLLWRATASLSSAKRAVIAGKRAVQLFERAGDVRDLAKSYKTLASGLWQTGELTEAVSAAENALSLFASEGLQETRVFADTLDTRANILRALGSDRAARAAFAEALAIEEKLGDERGAATKRGNLAELEFACGNTDRAIELAQEAAATFHRLGAVSREATVLVNAASYQIVRGEIGEAWNSASTGLKLARQTGDHPIVAVAFQNLAAVKAMKRDARAASLLIGYVNEWYRSEGYQRDVSERRTFDLIMESLRAQLSEQEILELISLGAQLSQEEAAIAAENAY